MLDTHHRACACNVCRGKNHRLLVLPEYAKKTTSYVSSGSTMRLIHFIWLIFAIEILLLLKYRSPSGPLVEYQDVMSPPTNVSPSMVSPTTRQKVLGTERDEFRSGASKYGWKRYTGKRALRDNHIIEEMDHKNSHQRDSTDTDKGIREGIGNKSIPFQCYPGEYGFFPPKYQKFINLLAEYTRNESKMSNKRVLAWHCRSDHPCGGIGDRLRGALSTFALALFSRRKFVMYWEAPSENLYLRPNMINWDDKQAIDKINQSKKNDTNVQKFIVRIIAPYYFSVAQRLKSWQSHLSTIQGDTPIVALATNIELNILLSNYTTTGQNWIKEGLNQAGLANLSKRDLINLLGIVFRYLFILEPSLIDEVQNAMTVLGIDGIPYVGLHIRTGFDGSHTVKDDSNIKCIKDRKKWMKALQCAVDKANKYTGNNSYIFLATDSPLVRDLAVSIFGLRFRTLDIGEFHVDKINKQLHAVTNEEDKGIVSMLIDVILLAHSYILVRWSSGYAHIAAVICGIPNKRNINSFTCENY